MKKMTLADLQYDGRRLMPSQYGEREITEGGVTVFQPGETVHPDYHVHELDEVFIFVQGRGVLPIDGVEYPIQTGDVFIVEAGEDHHTRSAPDESLVAVWYLVGE